MSLRTFMFAADELRRDDRVEWTMEPSAGVPVPSPAEVKKQNADAMSNLMSMMSGVKGAPVKR
jgi:hypothetical protein